MIGSIIRAVLNRALRDTTAEQLVHTLNNGLSLWGTSAETIREYAGHIPKGVITFGNSYIRKINRQYEGGMTGLVLEWLKTDQMLYYSLIINHPEGKNWLRSQVNEILDGLGIHER